MVRQRRLRAARGQQGSAEGTVLCPRKGRFLLRAYGHNWTLPDVPRLRWRLGRLLQPGQQARARVTVKWDARRGRHEWDAVALGRAEPLAEGQLALWEE